MRNSVGVPPVSDLSRSRTVPRELVHRRSVAEVLLTDVRRDRDGVFRAAACWPRSHPTFPADGSDRHSPLLIVETLRELGIYVPLKWYGVPPTDKMLIDDLTFTVCPDHEPRAGLGGTEVTCAVRVTDVRPRSDGAPGTLRLGVAFQVGGRVFARAGGGARFLSRERYVAVRGSRLGRGRQPAPASAPDERPEPGLLGVARVSDVVVARRSGAPTVEPADLRHPFFFDHSSDHMPGMVLLEAARQVAAESTGGTLLRPVRGSMAAARFTEYDPPAQVELVAHDHTCVFRVRQGGTTTVCGALGFHRHDE